MRHGFGDELDHLHRKIEGVQQKVVPKGRREQLMQPTAQPFDLDAVVERNHQNTDRQAHSGRQVSGRHYAHVSMVRVTAIGRENCLPNQGDQIHRQQVHGVHQENPDENRERQRGHKFAAFGVVDDAFSLRVDHLDQQLDRCLQAARNARGCSASAQPHHQAAEDAQRYRPEQGIHVEHGEVNNAAHRLVLQMGKVMADVLTSARSLLSSHISISLCHRENGLRSEEPAPTSSPSLLQPSPPLKRANSFHQAPYWH